MLCRCPCQCLLLMQSHFVFVQKSENQEFFFLYYFPCYSMLCNPNKQPVRCCTNTTGHFITSRRPEEHLMGSIIILTCGFVASFASPVSQFHKFNITIKKRVRMKKTCKSVRVCRLHLTALQILFLWKYLKCFILTPQLCRCFGCCAWAIWCMTGLERLISLPSYTVSKSLTSIRRTQEENTVLENGK